MFLKSYLFIIVRLLQSIVMVNGEWLWNPRVLVERRQLISCDIHITPWQPLLFTSRQMHLNRKTQRNCKKVQFLLGDINLKILFILPFSSEIKKKKKISVNWWVTPPRASNDFLLSSGHVELQLQHWPCRNCPNF